jgi:hypothetical protein
VSSNPVFRKLVDFSDHQWRIAFESKWGVEVSQPGETRAEAGKRQLSNAATHLAAIPLPDKWARCLDVYDKLERIGYQSGSRAGAGLAGAVWDAVDIPMGLIYAGASAASGLYHLGVERLGRAE